jgi:AraC-like DNA-binding protein
MVLDAVEEAFSEINDNATPSGAFYSAGAISDSVISVFDRFESVSCLSEAEQSVYSKLILAELLLLLSAAKREDFRPDSVELGARVIRYLNENTERDIPHDVLAKKFFVSQYYLCRAFKKHNGISVHGYINQKRIMYAKQLIELGETASGAAYKVGFGDYSAFYRAYVKIIGKSPTE